MQCIASLKKTLELHRIVKLRQRHIFTKNNRVRLRYVVGVGAIFAVLIVTLLGGSASSVALKWPDNVHEMQLADSKRVHGPEDVAMNDGLAEIKLQERISEGIRRASLAIQKPPRPLHQAVSIGEGDTVAGVLQQAGVTGGDAYYAVKALSEHYDPRTIKPGQKLDVHFKPEGENELRFSRLVMKLDPVKEITVRRDGSDKFVADLEEKKLVQRSYAQAAEIETSLYGSAARAGIPSRVIAEVIRVYSWDVDFQRDIRSGDNLQVLYETFETEDGEFARYGDVLYASLSVGGKDIPIYRYEMKDGRVDYFEPDGYSIRKTLMKTPIDGARISSGYGMRKHPILGYNKMHKGMDFAAPTGTPIYAAGDGMVEYAGRKGAYGNYIRIRHNSTLKTAYAHLHKFARGMGRGKRVEQGDVIGYVGTTGRSTGPHLHYEVLVNGHQKNPNSVDLPTGEQLEGEELRRFKGLMGALRQQYVALSKGLKFAQKNSQNRIR